MARSNRIRLRELRALYQLIGECRELGAEAQQWRAHLLEGLRQLVGAQVALYMQIENAEAACPKIIAPQDAGFLDREGRERWARYQREEAYRDDPFHLRFFNGISGVAAFRTRGLAEVVDPTAWRSCRHYNDFIRPCGLEDRITTALRLPGRSMPTMQVLVLHRSAEDGDYPGQMKRLVHLLHLELRPLLGQSLAMPEAVDGKESETGLPPRLQQVLEGLLLGESQKQIAARLRLSPHTVNRHVQRLYQRFDVQSRGELTYRCRHLLNRPTDRSPDRQTD